MVVLRTILLLALAAMSSAAAAGPDFTGIWQVRGEGGLLLRTNDEGPRFTAAGQELYERNRTGVAQRDVKVDLVQRCSTPGTPRTMLLPYPFEIFQHGDQVTMLFEWNQLFRQIVTGAGRDPFVQPSGMGFSAGRWEGDALVVTTTDFNDKTLLDNSGLPHGLQLRITEHWTLMRGGKQLENRLTIEDPQMYERPWHAVITFDRRDTAIAEDICLDRQQAGRPVIETPAQRRNAARADR